MMMTVRIDIDTFYPRGAITNPVMSGLVRSRTYAPRWPRVRRAAEQTARRPHKLNLTERSDSITQIVECFQDPAGSRQREALADPPRTCHTLDSILTPPC